MYDTMVHVKASPKLATLLLGVGLGRRTPTSWTVDSIRLCSYRSSQTKNVLTFRMGIEQAPASALLFPFPSVNERWGIWPVAAVGGKYQ